MGNKLYYIALIALLFGSCKRGELADCFTGAGDMTTEKREVSSFERIEIGQLFELELLQDTSIDEYVILEGPADVLDGIAVEVKDRVLKIRDENRCKWIREQGKRLLAKVNIHNLAKIIVNDAASIVRSDSLILPDFVLEQRSVGSIDLTLSSTQFEINSYEAGEITVDGYAATLVVTLYETGPFYSVNMQSDYCFVFNYGLNDVHVKPFKVLESLVENKGNCYYYSDPVERLSTKGRGPGKTIRK